MLAVAARAQPIVCVGSNLRLGIGQTGQLAKRRVGKGRSCTNAIGCALAATASIKGDQCVLVLGVDLFHRVTCTVVFGLGHIAKRIRSLCVSTKIIVNHVGTDIIRIANGKLIATCIISNRRDFVQLVERTNGTTCTISPSFGGIA